MAKSLKRGPWVLVLSDSSLVGVLLGVGTYWSSSRLMKEVPYIEVRPQLAPSQHLRGRGGEPRLSAERAQITLVARHGISSSKDE